MLQYDRVGLRRLSGCFYFSYGGYRVLADFLTSEWRAKAPPNPWLDDYNLTFGFFFAWLLFFLFFAKKVAKNEPQIKIWLQSPTRPWPSYVAQVLSAAGLFWLFLYGEYLCFKRPSFLIGALCALFWLLGAGLYICVFWRHYPPTSSLAPRRVSRLFFGAAAAVLLMSCFSDAAQQFSHWYRLLGWLFLSGWAFIFLRSPKSCAAPSC